MSPADAVVAYMRERMKLDANHEALIRSVVVERRVAKSGFLQRAGEVAQHGYFVASGCLRNYSIDDAGIEHTLGFAPENWWLTDRTGGSSPTVIFIQALEDSEVAQISMSGLERMMQGIPGYAAAYATGLTKVAAARDRRILAALSESAEQRYLSFMERFPGLAQRIPQHLIASYLGVTPETLSRVRRRLATRPRANTPSAPRARS